MKQKLLTKLLLMLLCLVGGTSFSPTWAQGDYSTDYTGNVTLSATDGTSTSSVKVKINNVSYNAIKAGTGSIAGAVKISVPSGTKYLHLHVVGWKGESVTLAVTPSGYSSNISLTSDESVSGSSTTFVLTNANSSTSYYKVITFSSPLAANTDLTFTASSGKRFVIWGVTAEAGSNKTAAGLEYAVSSYTNILPSASFDTPTLTNPNSLTVTYSSTDSEIAAVNSSTGAITIGTKEGTATITASSEETETYAAGEASYTITVAKGATTVTLSDDSWTTNILDGATKTLSGTPKYNSEAIKGAAVSWQSSNTSVATVTSGGVVTPVAPGTATITASYAGTDVYAESNNTCSVTVNKANTTLTLDETSVSQDLKDGRTVTLTPTVKAAKSDASQVDVVSPTITWTSSDETVATVSGGVVTGLKAGTATITASYAGGDNYNAATNATCSLTFDDTRTAVSISAFTAEKTTLVIGDEQATAVTNDQSGWTATYTYTSSDESVATVSASGVITAVAKGTATITVALNISLTETGYKAGATASKTLAITVTKPFHTVTFSVNGNTDLTASVEEDQKITFPTAVETTPGDNEFSKVINGQTFQGWYTAAYSNASVAPSYINTASMNMGTSDVTYYAVFATEIGGEEDASLTNSEITTNFTATTMAYGTAKTYNDTSEGITWEIAGYTDAANRPWIQQKKDKTSYMKITAAGVITEIKVKITSASNSSGGINDISKHTAYSNYVYLESSPSSSPSGACGSSNTISSNIVTLTPTTSSSTLYVQVNSGARVWGIDVTYDSTTGSNFTTDNRSDAGIAFANKEENVKLTSDYTGQELTNPNSLTVSYSSSDETVATVNSSTGAITELLKAGTTTITATFAGNATYKPAEVSYDLNITEKTPHGLAYATAEVAKLTTDAAFTNTLTNGNSLTVSYTSSATGVATVNSSTGEVTIKGAGSATITATFAGDEDYEAGSASYTLTVSKATPTLSFTSASATLRQGEAFDGNALTNPASLTVSYSSSNESVATVNSSGTPSFVAAGSTTITASFAGNDTYTSGSASYTLTVLAAPTITVSNQTIAWDETFTVDDSKIKGGGITVTSGNTSIATVDGLEITPKACGEVTITVSTAENGTYKEGSATFTLTINAPEGSDEAPSGVITTSFTDKNLSFSSGGVIWTASRDANSFESSSPARGVQFGAAVGDFTLSTTAISGTITKVSMVVSTNADANKNTIAVTVGGINFTNGGNNTFSMPKENNQTVEFTGSGSGTIVIFCSDTQKSIYFKSITVTIKTDATVALNKYGYGTFCSKYPMDFTNTEGYTAWRVSSIEDGTITFTKITEKIKGGQGVLLYNKDADGENKSNVTVKFADGSTVFDNTDANDDNDNLLVGVTADTYVNNGAFFGLSGTNFVPVAASVVPAGKALLPASEVSDVKAFTFVFEDEEDGIKTLSNSPLKGENIYNLAGQRISKMQKGINIVNGKKVLK